MRSEYRRRPNAARATWRLMGVLLAAVAWAGCAKHAPMQIHAEANPRADLAAYSTYEWTSAPKPAQRDGYRDDFAGLGQTPSEPAGASSWAAERADQQVRSWADSEMSRLGYTRRAPGQMLLSWHISTRHKQIQDTWGDFARYRAEGGTESAADAWIDGYEEGSLVIEARDARNDALLWYGTATAVVNPELREQRIPEAVAEIFSRWPTRSHARTTP